MVSDESTSQSSEIHNSATEISTDSEFAQDEAPARAQRCHVTASFIGPQRCDVVAAASPPRPINALNRTRSTGGIAAKVSLELKKKYLLGDGGGANLQKSGSAIALDTKFKRFQSAIADCQKLLKLPQEGATAAAAAPPSEQRTALPPPDLTVEIPRVEVHSAHDDDDEPIKSTKSEKKSLNQPKSLPESGATAHERDCHVTGSPEADTEPSDWALDASDSLMMVGDDPKPAQAINLTTTLDAHYDSLEFMDRSPSGGGDDNLLKPSDIERLRLAEPAEATSSESTVKRADSRPEPNPPESVEYADHCRRLQSKIEFGNARDSIDLRKSRKPDLLPMYSREQIAQERHVTKQVIEQIVMDKMKATLERRRRRRLDSTVAPPQPPPRRLKTRPTSIVELPKTADVPKLCKSETNLAEASRKRKSIGQMIAGIFCKKSPTGLLARLSPKCKSKSLTSLDTSKHETVIEEKRKCASHSDIQRGEVTPPPVPPLPSNYTLKDESSDGDNVTLDQSASNAELPSCAKRSGKARRMSRQAQLKRHRMAQEIQRKLQETEVKTREVEKRGVEVEKRLRGDAENGGASEESDLLREWFDLMRDRTELRRFEKELTIRAEELELADRHERLRRQLRERLENSDNDVTAEQTIVDQMIGVVAKRDSLIALLEEDRLKYSHEDKDLEEQMLAKGLMLTPIRKSTEK